MTSPSRLPARRRRTSRVSASDFVGSVASEAVSSTAVSSFAASAGLGLDDVDRGLFDFRFFDFGDFRLGLRRPRAAHTLGAAALRRPRHPRPGRLFAAATRLELVDREALEHDRDVRGALADPEVPAACTGLAVLAGRAFVGPRERRRTARRPAASCCARRSRSRNRAASSTSAAASFSQSCKHAVGVVDREAAHQLEHLAHLVRRGVQVPDRGAHAGVRRLVRLGVRPSAPARSLLARVVAEDPGAARTRRACARPSPR